MSKVHTVDDMYKAAHTYWKGSTKFPAMYGDIELTGKVLELGCNEFCSVAYMCETYKDIVIDCIDWIEELERMWPLMKEIYGDRLGELFIGNTNSIPAPDSHYDFVNSSDFFEHLNDEDYFGTLSESLRVLKPGGYMGVWVGTAEAPEHIRRVTHAQLVREMELCGFEMVPGKSIDNGLPVQLFRKPVSDDT
jgi:SAM-dependent methyltransferase